VCCSVQEMCAHAIAKSSNSLFSNRNKRVLLSELHNSNSFLKLIAELADEHSDSFMLLLRLSVQSTHCHVVANEVHDHYFSISDHSQFASIASHVKNC